MDGLTLYAVVITSGNGYEFIAYWNFGAMAIFPGKQTANAAAKELRKSDFKTRVIKVQVIPVTDKKGNGKQK